MTAPDTRDSAALLPCPFCGGRAKTKLPYVRCTECGGQMCFGDDANDSESAVAAWNRRALPQQAGGEDGVEVAPLSVELELEAVLGHAGRTQERLMRMAADAKALEAEVARLQRERDIYKAADESMQEDHHQALTRALAAEAALREESARLNEVRESLLRDLRTTTDTLIARAEAAEADARQLAASVHGAFKALGSDPPEPILKLANRYFRIERKLRKAAIGGTGSD